MSRLEARTDAGLSIDWPDIEGAEVIAEYLAELGHAQPGANGMVPITFGEIEAWARLTGIELAAWLVVLLRELSREYAYQANISGDAKCPPPYEMVANELDLATMRRDADKKVRDMFSNG